MTRTDSCCTLVPYFEIHEGKQDEMRGLCDLFVEQTRQEPGCMFYGFSFSERTMHCREGYQDAAGILNHLENVGALLDEALKISDLTRLEVHAPADQLDQLREPLADLNPKFFVLETGFRR